MATQIEPTVNPKDLLVEMREISDTSLIETAMAFYHHQLTTAREKVDHLAAEVYQVQDQIHFLNSLIADLNNETDKTTHGIDLTHHPEIVDKLRIAKELGVKIKGDQLSFDPEDRQILFDHLRMRQDEFDFDIKRKTQILDAHHKHLDRVILLMNEFRKCDDRMKKTMAANISR